MCGAVKFTALTDALTFQICHCEMCRRWTGSAFMGVSVPNDGLRFQGVAHIRTLQSSDWAERAWCGRCGSTLYYRLTGDTATTTELSLGLFDTPSDFTLEEEIFIDQKPGSYAFSGDHPRATRAEVMAKHGVSLD